MFQGLCGCEAKFVSRQATLSKALDRRVEETLNFNVQVEERQARNSASLAPMVVLPTQLAPARNNAYVATLREE
jgi:hypothetical protein